MTVFAHGLGASIADTRPLGSAVAGGRVFFHFRGHGRSAAPPGRWTYTDLARDLRAVADLSGATRAVGASLGAGALSNLLAANPTRFERVVFFLPSSVDSVPPGESRAVASRVRLGELLAAVEAGETATVAELIAQEIPTQLRYTSSVWDYLRQRLDRLMRDGLAQSLAGLPEQVPVADPAALGAVAAPALVIGCRGDEMHPVSAAERLSTLLPRATLHVYDQPGIFWTHRADLRERISGFLNAA